MNALRSAARRLTCPARLDAVIDDIRDLALLPRGWDGQDANPISSDAIEAAERLAAMLKDYEATLAPFADPKGFVGFEGSLGKARMLLSVAADGTLAYVIKENQSVQRGHSVTPAKFLKLLSALS